MMTEPLSLEAVLSEFDDKYEAWVLRDPRSGQYVMIPHARYPGRTILHFFMSRDDAMTVLDGIVRTGNETIAMAPIVPVKVNLHEALCGIANSKTPGFADAFVVHSPNEVFENFGQ